MLKELTARVPPAQRTTEIFFLKRFEELECHESLVGFMCNLEGMEIGPEQAKQVPQDLQQLEEWRHRERMEGLECERQRVPDEQKEQELRRQQLARQQEAVRQQ